MLPLAKVLGVADDLKKSLLTYLYVRSVARGLPDRITSEVSRDDYIAHVRVAAVEDLKMARYQPEYIQYLEALSEESWNIHLQDAVRIRDRARRTRAVPVQGGGPSLQAPEGDVLRSGAQCSVRGVQPAGDGED